MDKNKTIPSRPSLGKGLASLLPGAASMARPQASQGTTMAHVQPAGLESQENKDRLLGISMCNIEEIAPNEFQPRKQFNDESIQELAQSIKENGLIQPLIVRKGAKGYQLIAGERRWRAAKLAGMKQVPIVIRRSTDKESFELALIENIQREELNSIDTALAYYQLIQDFSFTQETLSSRLGKDRATIANHLRLIKLPAKVQEMIKANQLSFGHGRALAGIEDAGLIEKLAESIVLKKWSVRELETQIQNIKNLNDARAMKAGAASTDPVAMRMKALGRQISSKLSTKVSFKGNDAKGKVLIEYFSRDELERIVEFLGR